MKIKTQDYEDATVVELQGEFDADFTEMFRNTIIGIVEGPGANSVGRNAEEQADKKLKNDRRTASHRGGIVLDMSGVGFIDSEGLEYLLWAKDYCNENNCQLKLAGLDENCTKILEVTRLKSEFDHYAELAEAVMSFA